MIPFHYAVVAIPLNRPHVIDFLLPPTATPRGTAVQILAQRPTSQAEADWVSGLQQLAAPTVSDLLAIDSPHNHLVTTHTDRLVPNIFLEEPGFLRRNLGGWSPIYFATMGLPRPLPADPLLDQVERLVDYGAHIDYYGADPAQVAARLPLEMEGREATAVAGAYVRLLNGRSAQPTRTDTIENIYREIVAGSCFADHSRPPLPRLLLLDELMAQLVRLELERRTAVANRDEATADAIAAWQEARRSESGLQLILKGEYIAGRHRRSTILIAPELGVVVKQPAPEPFHEIEMNARTYNGRSENWPVLTRDNKLVTPRGRLRLILEEDFIPRLHQVFDHEMTCVTLLGLTVEAFVVGPTLQEVALADPDYLTAELYETILLHQQVCEALGVENGDWHSANFIRRAADDEIVHIDWGAARPLRPNELAENGRLARFNQVKNIAFSFHDDALAGRVLALHEALAGDDERLAQLRAQAERMVGE